MEIREVMARAVLAAAALVVAVPVTAAAFGTVRTHEELANAALTQTAGAIDAYLMRDLDLESGTKTRLAIQIGLVPELATKLITGGPKPYYEGRLNKSQSALEAVDGEWRSFPDAPERVFYRIPGKCRGQPDFDACYRDLERVDIAQLILIGSYAEDNPNPRSKHHFHDLERSHGWFPAGNHGLDDAKPFLLGLDALVAEATTLARGGSVVNAPRATSCSARTTTPRAR